VGGCQKLGDTCRMYQLTTELAERDSESKRARGVEIAQAEQLTELQKQHSGLSQNGPEKSCVQKSFKTSCMTQGSHIVADPIYAPSGGCTKNLLLQKSFKKSCTIPKEPRKEPDGDLKWMRPCHMWQPP